MSKGSKIRRQLLRQLKEQQQQGQQPSGQAGQDRQDGQDGQGGQGGLVKPPNMLDRMTELNKAAGGYGKPDNRLPAHYGGQQQREQREIGFTSYGDNWGKRWSSDGNGNGHPINGNPTLYVDDTWKDNWDKPPAWKVNGGDEMNGYQGYQPYGRKAEEDTVFRCDSTDIMAACPIAKTPLIYLPKRLFNEWIALAEDIDTEWMAYLKGRYDEGERRWYVTGMYFPPQVVTPTHVEAVDGYEPEKGTIGVVHSHVRMGVFFSHEDMAHSNWDVEIVVNAKGDVKSLVRHKLKCGEWAKGESKVYVTGDGAAVGWMNKLKQAIAQGQQRFVDGQPQEQQGLEGLQAQQDQVNVSLEALQDMMEHNSDIPLVLPPGSICPRCFGEGTTYEAGCLTTCAECGGKGIKQLIKQL